jgi:hypothetical protein
MFKVISYDPPNRYRIAPGAVSVDETSKKQKHTLEFMKTYHQKTHNKAPQGGLMFHSKAAAAAYFKVPVVVMRQLEKAGADGFKVNGNIDGWALILWLLTKGQDFMPQLDLESAKALLTQAKAAQYMRAAKKEAGELVPTADLMRVVKMVMHVWTVSIPQISTQLAHAICPKEPNTIEGALRLALLTGQENVLAAILSQDQFGLPSWAINALRTGIQEHDEVAFKGRVVMFKDFFGRATADCYGKAIKRIETEHEAEQAKDAAWLASIGRAPAARASES